MPIYRREPESGALILDEENEPILDADFSETLLDMLHSPAADHSPWLLEEKITPFGPQSAGQRIESVVAGQDLILDPKRFSAKYTELVESITSGPNFVLGEILQVCKPPKLKLEPATIYKYVEIEKIGIGDYDYEERRGWELPQRARLRARNGDFFIPHIWGCAGKWFVSVEEDDNLIVTNGCAHLEARAEADDLLVDLMVGLCSEAFAVQVRALATGSDGLAEVSDADLLKIVIPKLTLRQREDARTVAASVLQGRSRFSKFAANLVAIGTTYPFVPNRKSHCALV